MKDVIGVFDALFDAFRPVQNTQLKFLQERGEGCSVNVSVNGHVSFFARKRPGAPAGPPQAFFSTLQVRLLKENLFCRDVDGFKIDRSARRCDAGNQILDKFLGRRRPGRNADGSGGA